MKLLAFSKSILGTRYIIILKEINYKWQIIIDKWQFSVFRNL
jgi:hypothetical protein